MPRVTEIKYPPTRAGRQASMALRMVSLDWCDPTCHVGSKSIQWLARLKRAFRAC